MPACAGMTILDQCTVTNKNIAIIGAGIGGLTAALALIRQGFGVDVYEQAPELKELGAGVQISSNGTRVLYALGLGEAAERLGVVVAGKEIRLWSTGQTWKLFDLGAVSVERYGFPYMMFHRGDLHAVLLDAIRRERPDAIHLDRKCTGVTQNEDSVTIEFERGEAVMAPIVIGADGVQSRVRFAVFGADRPEFTGIVAWRGLVPRDRVPAGIKLDVGTNWVGPGGHVVHYPVRGGALLNFVGLLERDDWRVESWTCRARRMNSPTTSAAGIPTSMPAFAASTCPTSGRCSHGRQCRPGRRAASRSWATPATPCCRCWRRAR